jgi:hypothetical protein
MAMTDLRRPSFLAVLVWLAACGGGEGDDAAAPTDRTAGAAPAQNGIPGSRHCSAIERHDRDRKAGRRRNGRRRSDLVTVDSGDLQRGVITQTVFKAHRTCSSTATQAAW